MYFESVKAENLRISMVPDPIPIRASRSTLSVLTTSPPAINEASEIKRVSLCYLIRLGILYWSKQRGTCLAYKAKALCAWDASLLFSDRYKDDKEHL